MVEECRIRDIYFAAGLVARNYPEYWKARELIEAGEIGDVQSINIYDKNGQGGCHGINLALHFAGDPEAEWVTGWVEGDPFSDYQEGHEEGTAGFGGIGGYIRFDNGVEAFSHVKHNVKNVTTGPIDVVGASGVLYNDGLGLHLLKEVRVDESQRLGNLEEVEVLFPSRHLGGKVSYDEEGWRVPTPGMMATVAAIVESLDNGTRPQAEHRRRPEEGLGDLHRAQGVGAQGASAGQAPSRRPEPKDVSCQRPLELQRRKCTDESSACRKWRRT